MAYFGDGRIHGGSQVKHAERAIAEAGAVRVHVCERRGGVGAASDAERYFAARDQVEVAYLVLQTGIRQALNLVKDIELVSAGHVIEQGSRRKLGVHQAV
ncbi:hypothetical protein ALP32_200051 [Pseudomonas avellanae]|uniref:Uncharacterized protein n=1 Tax=Pseudomonas avellanae TaxID=46257 RepID=A0A3M5TBI8_9PSED|nr:hypothetical protein ALP32_200051 [Pseudomonas avellanae]